MIIRVWTWPQRGGVVEVGGMDEYMRQSSSSRGSATRLLVPLGHIHRSGTFHRRPHLFALPITLSLPHPARRRRRRRRARSRKRIHRKTRQTRGPRERRSRRRRVHGWSRRRRSTQSSRNGLVRKTRSSSFPPWRRKAPPSVPRRSGRSQLPFVRILPEP